MSGITLRTVHATVEDQAREIAALREELAQLQRAFAKLRAEAKPAGRKAA